MLAVTSHIVNTLIAALVALGMLAPCPCDACVPLEQHASTSSTNERSDRDDTGGCCPGESEDESPQREDSNDHVCAHCGSDTFTETRATLAEPVKAPASPLTLIPVTPSPSTWPQSASNWVREGVLRANPPPLPASNQAPTTSERIATLQTFLC